MIYTKGKYKEWIANIYNIKIIVCNNNKILICKITLILVLYKDYSKVIITYLITEIAIIGILLTEVIVLIILLTTITGIITVKISVWYIDYLKTIEFIIADKWILSEDLAIIILINKGFHLKKSTDIKLVNSVEKRIISRKNMK